MSYFENMRVYKEMKNIGMRKEEIGYFTMDVFRKICRIE